MEFAGNDDRVSDRQLKAMTLNDIYLMRRVEVRATVCDVCVCKLRRKHYANVKTDATAVLTTDRSFFFALLCPNRYYD